MAVLKTADLKFLMKLLGCEKYRGKIAALSPNSGTKSPERDNICKGLGAQGIVEYESQVASFAIAPPGKTLLTLDTTSLPVTPDELKVLKACNGNTTPGKISGVPSNVREDLIRNLAERGMVKIKKESIKSVWLSAQGKQFLLYEYEPSGSYFAAASGNMLGNYVRFLRDNLDQSVNAMPASQPVSQSASAIPVGSQVKPDNQAVFQQIKQLDQLLRTDNYLPIFHLREKLQPPLTRSELDDILYALQREDLIELSTLHDQGKYSDEQLSAGIQQNNRAYLFFISII